MRQIVQGLQVVLLVATEAEARPVLAGMRNVRKYSVAGKSFYVGAVECARPSSGEARPFSGKVGGSGGRSSDHRAQGGGSSCYCGLEVPLVLAVAGCDKANVAHALTCLLEAMVPPPLLVLQAGIAGAFPNTSTNTSKESAPAVGDVVLATFEAYSDTGSSSPEGWLSAADLGLPIASVEGAETGGSFWLDGNLVAAAAEAVTEADWAGLQQPAVVAGPCVTSSRVTGLAGEAELMAARWGALAESMEGAAGAHICALYGVPFLEVRGISNLVTDRDRTCWQVERAAAVAARAALAVVAALERLPLPGRA